MTHIIVHVWPFCIEEAQTSHFHVLTYIELGRFFLRMDVCGRRIKGSTTFLVLFIYGEL
jgi:hypothetical protein